MGVGRQAALQFLVQSYRSPSTSRPPRVSFGGLWRVTGANWVFTFLEPAVCFGVCLPFPIQYHGGSQEGHLPEGLESRPLA